MKKLLIIILTLCLSINVFAKININTANVDELKELRGIGEAKAELIIDYREKNGNFTTIEDLQKVKGIGEKLIKKLKNDISVTGKTDLSDLSS